MRPRLQTAALALIVAVLPGVAVGDDGWRLDLHLNPAALSMWDLQWQAAPGAQRPQSAERAGYERWEFHAVSPAEGSDAAHSATVVGHWRLQHGDRTLRFAPARLQLRPDLNAVFISDAKGTALLIGDMPHRHSTGKGLDWRNMNLRLLPAAAARLGRAELADQAIGGVDLRGPALAEPKGSVSCRPSVVWPSESNPADIALINIPAVRAVYCPECSASSTHARVVIAPDAELLNVGSSDVAWYPKFNPPMPPYNNDQHPFLVWSLYRIDSDGSLRALGSSGIKHAFFAQNDMCSCNGDTVLYAARNGGSGCSDLYSAFTNDVAGFLGPRSELAPRPGLWGRCGSVFDPNCDGFENTSGYATNRFERRLVVDEAELLAANHPGASYWIEAWYVVRDDANLDNSYAHRQVVPSKSGSAWLFANQGATAYGPVVNRWVDPAAPAEGEHSQRVSVADGRAQLAVRVTPTAGGYRYRYALMNLDYADADFSGSEPGLLRMLAQRGLRSLEFEAQRCAALGPRWISEISSSAEGNWTVAGSGRLVAASPTDDGLGWGRLGVFEFTSPAAPVDATLRIGLGDGSVHTLTARVPDPASCQFRGGFEDALD